MIHAYDEVYLERAQRILGVAFDFAVNGLKIELKDFYWMFLASGYAKRMEYGDYRVIAGSSGAELVYNVTEASGLDIPTGKYSGTLDRSPEYWAGWALAFYQWYSSLSFMDILTAVPLSGIISMYPVYHEMDVTQFADHMDALMKESSPSTRLRAMRSNCGLSQSELAADSGVALRQIQLFEQRQRDINNAAAITLLMLSRSLHCRMEDLMEYVHI